MLVSLWFAASAFGGLPFLFTPHYASFTDTFFETASGFTTTGATILADVEVLRSPFSSGGASPTGSAAWDRPAGRRHPAGRGARRHAALPRRVLGRAIDRLKPRIAETALALWKIYVALSIANSWRSGSRDEPFDAICHTFATLGTELLDEDGVGRRVQNPPSSGSSRSSCPGGMSFIQHYRLFGSVNGAASRGTRDPAYALLVAASNGAIAASLIWQNGFGIERAIRGAAFQVASIATTTGFASENYELWSPLSHVVLLLLMYIAGARAPRRAASRFRGRSCCPASCRAN